MSYSSIFSGAQIDARLGGDLSAATTVILPANTSIGGVSATELTYLDGVTSALQTQLNGKAALAGSGSQAFSTALLTTTGSAFITGDIVKGSATSISVGGYANGLQLHGTAWTDGASMSIMRYNNDTAGGSISIGKSRSAAVGGTNIVQTGDSIGEIAFIGADGATLGTRAAQILVTADGAPGVGSVPSKITFISNTNARMTIVGNGNVLVGTTFDDGIGKLQVSGSVTASRYIGSGIFNSFNMLGTGQAVEVGCSAGIGVLYSYDRGAAGYLPLNVRGSVVTFNGIAGGNVLIGTTTDDGANKLQVNGTLVAQFLKTLRVENDSSTRTALLFNRGSGAGTNMYIGTNGDSSNGLDGVIFANGVGVVPIKIQYSGRVLVGHGCADIAAGAKLQVVDGITFPATQVASANVNTLDDYEEGTWTPVISGSTTAGTHTYVFQDGVYTKIGQQVTLQFKVRINVKDAAMAGNVQIIGSPFSANSHGASGCFGHIQYVTYTANYTSLGTDMVTNILTVYQAGSGQIALPLPASALTNSSNFFGSITFTV